MAVPWRPSAAALHTIPEFTPAAHFLKKENPESFFKPEAYKKWAAQWHADHPGEDKKTHILFDARGKTELSSAVALMKALASDSEHYIVSYLSPGGSWVKRRGTDGRMRTHIVEPDESLQEGDVVTYEAALPDAEITALQNAGIHVVLKSIFTNEKDWLEFHVRPDEKGRSLEVGWDWEREKFGDERLCWIRGRAVG